jgi:hypothetical protein
MQSTSLSITEILAQFGAASAFAGVLATLLWRVLRESKEERASIMRMMSDDNQRNIEAMNGLKDVLNDLNLSVQFAMKDNERRDRR